MSFVPGDRKATKEQALRMEFLDGDGDVEGMFDERVRVRKKNALLNITNRVGDVPLDREGKGEAAGTIPPGGGEGSVRKMPEDGESLRGVGRGRVVFKESSGDGGRQPNATAGIDHESGMGEQKNDVMLSIQREFEELKEAHRKTLKARGKLIRAMEKEVSELRRAMKDKRKAEIEDLRRQYEEEFLERKRMYKEAWKKKVLEYKRKLDEVYRSKIISFRKKCEEAVRKARESWGRKRP